MEIKIKPGNGPMNFCTQTLLALLIVGISIAPKVYAEDPLLEVEVHQETGKTEVDQKKEIEKKFKNSTEDLKTFRKQLSVTKSSLIEDIQNRIDSMKSSAARVKELEALVKNQSQEIGKSHYDEIAEIWRDIVDRSVSSLFNTSDVPWVQSVPLLPPEMLELLEQHKDLKTQLEAEQQLAKADIESMKMDILNKLKAEKEVGSNLLLNAGRVRAKVIAHLLSEQKISLWSFDFEQLKDYAREIQIVPYRALAAIAEKILEFRRVSQNGIRGWVDVSNQIFILIFVFALPFIIFKVFNIFSNYLEDLRRIIFNKSQLDYKLRTKVALWIGRINPYLPWVFAYLTLKWSESLLLGTLLDPLATILPYLKIYVLYRAFSIFLSSTLGRILLSQNLNRLRSKQQKVQQTARRISLLFFVEWILLTATEDVVRRALVHNAFSQAIFFINLLVIAVETRSWKPELILVGRQWLPDSFPQKISDNKVFFFDLIACPLLFLGNVFYLLAGATYRVIGQYEFGKKLSSELFKKRLQDAKSTEDNSSAIALPQEYLNLYSFDQELSEDIKISLPKSQDNLCFKSIDKWIEDKAPEDLLLVTGDYGSGKSTLLKTICRNFESKIDVKTMCLSKKMIHAKDVFQLLSEALGTEINTNKALKSLDSTLSKTIVILDNVHNLYLNKADGLDAYRTLIEVTNLQLQNIFWCLSANEKVLAHLNGIFGNDHFMGTKVSLSAWSDAEIQEFILKRHKQSGYQLQYDQVISAVHKGDILETTSSPEVQFFRLLWGQSKGNPATAMQLWLTSVEKVSDSTLRISVPQFTSSKVFNGVDDEMLLVFAAIVKHENLTFSELKSVSNVSERSLLKSVKRGEDSQILQRVGRNKWRIHPKSQHVVHTQLVGRNLIYG